ncbi:glycerophosphodiester phosphodiesterase family protein [Phaeobacter sp. QD34_3]|uniref:glycerophosphodiester phosphodiesterase family protein n=1 Tax=unclassified Phaeobacter TaxID=2621772 RepID=UPI00237F336F|nr:MULTISPECIES: glycerophosphodiester phosphodiesterase family protein [unclassified Phaeobacter]MDE4133057.1 glycerophosphodiester phosphodiesterase family protein [Phaeobacter sp. QD34_3]MDE4136541.1 glycerophosphodiester phosphodiesterase family protein [Phaeobacter sp. QD34_24]MDE4174271.1 glycerophosphodiester phosphodiesterase family protein [Phaeobacter sp. PT47_59]
MRPSLPQSLLRLPVAHRALHDIAKGRPENSRAAIRAAIAAGYAIEIDLQLSSDGCAMVFHDDDLDRLTDETGPVRARSREALRAIALKGGDGEGIPDLAEVLDLVAGQVPLLIEVKDQDGQMGRKIGPLEAAAVKGLEGYRGDVALMSFNPHSVERLAALAPQIPRGIVTSAYVPEDWPELPRAVCHDLRNIPDFERSDACFISHEAADLARPRVQGLRDAGVPVLCWTITSPAEEAAARGLADNVTFEGYLSALPT